MTVTKHFIKVGEQYDLWTVLHKIEGSKLEKWMCRCKCGTEKAVIKSHLYNHESKSCGCVGRAKMTERNTSHGLAHTKEYGTWQSIKKRCYNKNCKDYKDYGEVGIKVSDEWLASFEGFLADMGQSPKDGQKWSIGRLDNSLGYCKENCRWEIDEQQARNKTMLCTNTSGKTGVTERFRDGRTSFVATWRDLNGKKQAREISAMKWGYDNARRMAEKYRDEAIAKLNAQGAGYSEKHGL